MPKTKERKISIKTSEFNFSRGLHCEPSKKKNIPITIGHIFFLLLLLTDMCFNFIVYLCFDYCCDMSLVYVTRLNIVSCNVAC